MPILTTPSSSSPANKASSTGTPSSPSTSTATNPPASAPKNPPPTSTPQPRAKGAPPVLATTLTRRTFDASGKITNPLAGYPDAMREIAAAQHTPLIDLNAMSKTLFEALGPDGAMKAFMHYPANAFPNQTEPINDDTHFNSSGAYELARCVVHGLREANLYIANFLSTDLPDFTPSHPDPPPD